MDCDRIAYWEGERCEVRLGLSHFSSLDLRDCRIEWFLDLAPEICGRVERLGATRGPLTTRGSAARALGAPQRPPAASAAPIPSSISSPAVALRTGCASMRRTPPDSPP